jgi:hypothetical protein
MSVSGQYEPRSDVGQLDATQWDSLLVPHEGHDLWFKPEAKGASFLEPNAVTIIKDRGVLKVKSVSDEGDHLVVENDRVVLEDFIENGTVSFSGSMAFDTPFEDYDSDLDVVDNAPSGDATDDTSADDGAATQLASATLPTSLYPAVFPTPDSTKTTTPGAALYQSAKDVVLDGWKVDKTVSSVSGNGDDLQYDITLTKPSGVFDGSIHIAGKINNLKTAFNAEIQNHMPTSRNFDVSTSGEADFSWAIHLNEGSASYNKIIKPGVTYRYQFFVQGVPLVLRISLPFAVIIAATGKGSVTTGKVHVTYTTDGGVSIEDATGSSNASGTGDAAFDSDQGTVTVGPGAFGFVSTLPKIEFGVGVEGLFATGASFTNVVTAIVQSAGAIGGSPCASIDATLEGKLGFFVDSNVILLGQILKKGFFLVKLVNGDLSHSIYKPTRHYTVCF